MKSKLLIASMSILGLINHPAFAATNTPAATSETGAQTTSETGTQPTSETGAQPTSETGTQPTSETGAQTTAETGTQTTSETAQTTETHAHRTAQRMPKSNMRALYPRPRRMGNLTIKPAPIFCLVNSSTIQLRDMTQNVGRSLPIPCNPSWVHRIALSGGVNVDVGKFGNRSVNYMGENYQHASINDAYLNLSAVPNDITTVFMSLSFNSATINNPLSSTTTHHVAEFDAAYSNNIRSGGASQLLLEQGYVTFANFEKTPVYVQLGKQFQDYGRYELHPITEPLTQVMTKTLYTSFKIGFIWKQFNGAAFAFEDPLPKVNHTSKSMNYGFSINYSHDLPSCQIGVDAGVSWLYNIVDVNDIAYIVNQFNLHNPTNLPGGGFNQHTSGMAVYLDAVSGPFNFNGRLALAVQRFNVADLPRQGLADFGANGLPLPGATGAQPWTASVQFGYGFGIWGKPQHIYVGAQASNQAAALLIPRARYLAGYSIEMVRNTNLGIEWDYDYAYGANNGGTGKNTNLITLRGAVKFG